jgi:hypothetical protein
VAAVVAPSLLSDPIARHIVLGGDAKLVTFDFDAFSYGARSSAAVYLVGMSSYAWTSSHIGIRKDEGQASFKERRTRNPGFRTKVQSSFL